MPEGIDDSWRKGSRITGAVPGCRRRTLILRPRETQAGSKASCGPERLEGLMIAFPLITVESLGIPDVTDTHGPLSTYTEGRIDSLLSALGGLPQTRLLSACTPSRAHLSLNQPQREDLKQGVTFPIELTPVLKVKKSFQRKTYMCSIGQKKKKRKKEIFKF